MTTKQLNQTWKVKLRSSFRAVLIVRRVVGDSMMPSLKKDQFILATSLRRAQEGTIVVVHVEGREVIKRVTKLRSQEVWIEGDNPSVSRDSRRYGWIDRSAILGVVIFPLRKENV